MSVQSVEDSYMILGEQSWLPGMYATRAVAERAEADFTPEQLGEIAARVGGRAITAADLDEAGEG